MSPTDPTLLDLLTRYKRRVAGSYRALTPEEIPTVTGQLAVTRKLDGELWFLGRGADGPFLVNPGGRNLTAGFPVLEQAQRLPQGVLLAGELHVDAGEGRERVGDLSALLAGAAEATRLCFTAFDLLRDATGSDLLAQPYDQRFEALATLVADGVPNLRRSDPQRVNGPVELQALFTAMVVEGGAEGLIVRSAQGIIYKLKPTRDVDAVVIAFTERADEPGQVRSLLLGLMHEDGRVQMLGGCGNLGSAEMRATLHQRLVGSVVPSAVRHASDSGALYRFVRPELVVTVRMTELQGERSDGTATTTPVLGYGDSGWVALGTRPCPRPLHPVLERIRDDKQATTHDVRFVQVADRLPLDREQAPSAGPLPASTVLRREVWTKAGKGSTAVRKLVVWRSNKERQDAAFPAYVVHWTDYSAGRGTPLEREVRLAPTEALAMQLADGIVAENIKKGWAKVGG
jgi:hypothetical protein